MSHLIDDPFEILGVTQDADEEVIRARYLELVKEFPPERDPEKFRQIQEAYRASCDPLRIARRLLQPPDANEPPSWSDVIDEHEHRPPNLPVEFLLSLGNRDQKYGGDSTPDSDQTANSTEATTAENSQTFVDPAHE